MFLPTLELEQDNWTFFHEWLLYNSPTPFGCSSMRSISLLAFLCSADREGQYRRFARRWQPLQAASDSQGAADHRWGERAQQRRLNLLCAGGRRCCSAVGVRGRLSVCRCHRARSVLVMLEMWHLQGAPRVKILLTKIRIFLLRHACKTQSL